MKYSYPTDTVLSVIILTHNDQDIIADRLADIYRVLKNLKLNFEILIIDNNSTDSTLREITALKKILPYTRILVLSKKYDPEIALTAGLDNCIGDFAILFNLYLDPPEVKPRLLEQLLAGNDIVIGKMSKAVNKQDFLGRAVIWLAQRLSQHGFLYQQNYLMALNRRAINSIIRTRRKSRNFSYIHSLIGFKKQIIKYKPLTKFRYKLASENFFTILFAVIDTIISNSFRPIRLLCLTGLTLSLAFLIYILGIVLLIYVAGYRNLAPQGWISIATVVGSMFFLLFSLLTLMSEYIIRILNESRNEPFYFISEEINQSIILPKKRMLNIV